MRKAKPEFDKDGNELPAHGLVLELREAMAKVGEARYAGATARHFARGGKYHPAPKRARYALSEEP